MLTFVWKCFYLDFFKVVESKELVDGLLCFVATGNTSLAYKKKKKKEFQTEYWVSQKAGISTWD